MWCHQGSLRWGYPGVCVISMLSRPSSSQVCAKVGVTDSPVHAKNLERGPWQLESHSCPSSFHKGLGKQ